MPKADADHPRWTGIPVRVVLMTALFTLLAFAVGLLLSILGTVVYSLIAHVSPNLPFAYRHIALPFAICAGAIAMVLFLVMEVRHYRQRKTLAGIARAS